MAGFGCDAGVRKAVGDILQDGRISVSTSPVVGAQRRHQPERVNCAKIRAVVLHHFGVWIDFDVIASAPASYSAILVASEQASGEKYRSMGCLLGG